MHDLQECSPIGFSVSLFDRLSLHIPESPSWQAGAAVQTRFD
jgi:hypothetical protein